MNGLRSGLRMFASIFPSGSLFCIANTNQFATAMAAGVCDLRYNEGLLFRTQQNKPQSAPHAARPVDGCNIRHVQGSLQLLVCQTEQKMLRSR